MKKPSATWDQSDCRKCVEKSRHAETPKSDGGFACACLSGSSYHQPRRVEAHTPAIIPKDDPWSEWQGNYTIVHPVQADFFQWIHEGGQPWSFHIRMTDEGELYFARRRPIGGLPDRIILGARMRGKSI